MPRRPLQAPSSRSKRNVADDSKRWCQYGLLSSHSRLHGSGAPRVPWVVDEEACDVLRKFTLLKHRLEPYLTTHSIDGVVNKGHPLMRPMLLEFPDDRTTWFLDQQYMFGPDLLVAPVFGESRVDYYVPEGTWTNVLTGDEVTGPAWVSEDHSMITLPLLLRPDAAIVIGRGGHTVLDNASKGFTVVVSRRCSTKTIKVYTRKGSFEVGIKAVEGGLEVTSDGEFEVVVIGNGQGLEQEGTVGRGVVNVWF